MAKEMKEFAFHKNIVDILKDCGVDVSKPKTEVVYRDVPAASPAEKSAKGQKAVAGIDKATPIDTSATHADGDKAAAATEHTMAFLPAVEPKDYIEPEWAEYVYKYWDRSKQIVCLLVAGPRGTGKSQMAQVYSARVKRPCLTVNCNAEMSAASFLGRSRLDLKNKGGDYWFPGPIMIAAMSNAVLVLDEFNYTRSEVHGILNSITDQVQNGIFNPATNKRVEWIRPRIIIPINEGYHGTKEIQEALRDRCHPVRATYLPEKDEINLIVGRTGVDVDVAAIAVKTANAIRAAAKGTTQDGSQRIPLKFDLSPRALFDYAEQITLGRDKNKAWYEAVVGRIGWSFRTERTRLEVMELSKNVGSFDFTGMEEA